MLEETDNPGRETRGFVQWGNLLDALRRFDESAAPVGLYASEEYQMKLQPHPHHAIEWEHALRPEMGKLGFAARRHNQRDLREGRFTFSSTSGPGVELRLVRISKIKVRLYGNAFRLDPHHDFSERWDRAKVRTHLRTLDRGGSWSWLEGQIRLLLLVGFGAEADPFAPEMEELATSTGWRKTGVVFSQRLWLDPHGRRFHTLAALWVHEPH